MKARLCQLLPIGCDVDAEQNGDSAETYFLFFSNKANDQVLVQEDSLLHEDQTSFCLQFLLWNKDDEDPMSDNATLVKRVEEALGYSSPQYHLLYHDPLVVEWRQHSGEDWNVRVLFFDNLNLPPNCPRGSVWISKEEVLSSPLLELPKHKWMVDDGELTRVRSLPQSVKCFFTTSSVGLRALLWENQGWHAQASSWVSKRLEGTKVALAGPLTRLRGRAESIVMSAPTKAGRKVFFKALAETTKWRLQPSEAQITSILSKELPKSLAPNVLAISLEREWMITKQFGPDLDEECYISDYQTIFGALARFQRVSVDRAKDLHSAGCKCQVSSLFGQMF